MGFSQCDDFFYSDSLKLVMGQQRSKETRPRAPVKSGTYYFVPTNKAKKFYIGKTYTFYKETK